MSFALRFLTLVALGLLSVSAWADWSFCRLAEDRVLILDGSQRFVLKKGAGWTLADNTQKAAFDKWRTANKLPADPAEVVAKLPSGKSTPLAGQIELPINGDEQKTVRFTIGEKAHSVNLLPAADGEWTPQASDSAKVKEVASALKTDVSTLLVKLAQKTGLLEQEAWGAVLARLTSGREFFTTTEAGVLWARSSSAPPVVPKTNTTTTGGTEPPKKEPEKEKEPGDKPAGGSSLLLVIGAAGLALLTGAGLGFWFGRSRSGAAKGGSREGRLGSLSHHEEQLVRKVRDESRSSGDDERVVGKMLESFSRYDALKSELAIAQTNLQQLENYRQYSEQFHQFDSQAQKIKQTLTETEAQLSTARRELDTQRSHAASLQSELHTANNRVSGLNTELESSYKLVDDIEKWQKNLAARLQTIMDQDDK